MATIPGVYVTTDVRTGPPTGVAPAGAALFAIGEAAFGPIDKVVTVENMDQFEEAFGGRYGNGYLWDTAKVFFEEGGSTMRVLRAWKDAAPNDPVVGKLASIKWATSDTADTELTIRAKYLGAWGNSITASYAAGVLTIGGLPGGKTEVFSGITTVGSAVTLVNDVVNGSKYVSAEVTLKNAGTPPVDPTATITGSPTGTLSGAATAQTPVYADIVSLLSTADTAPQYFGKELGVGAVAVPGYGPTTTNTGTDDGYDVWVAMIQHAVLYNRICILSFGDDNMSVADVVTAKQNFVTLMGTITSGVPSDTKGLEYVAIYHSWVTVPNGTGGSRAVPPDGYVAAARTRAAIDTGSHRPGAGAISTARYVIAPVMSFTTKEKKDLANALVNPILVIAGSVRVYGARTPAADQINWTFISYRDTCNYIAVEAESRMEPYVFDIPDTKLFSKIEGALIGLCEVQKAAGALWERVDSDGQLLDPGYAVNAGVGINPVSSLADGVINAEMGIRVSPVGERINLKITKSALGSSL